MAVLIAALSVVAESYITGAYALIVTAGLIGRWVAYEPSLPEGEVRLLAEQSDLPLEASGTRAAGWWGMLSLLAVLFTLLGALVYSYFYLRLYSDQWPQAGLPAPDPTAPSAALSMIAAGAMAQVFAARGRLRNRLAAIRWGIAVSIALGSGFVAVEVADLIRTPFLPTANAYASIYFTLSGFSILIVFSAVAFQVGALARLIARREPLDKPRLRLWLQNSEMLWFFALGAAVVALLTTRLVPHVL